MKLIQLGTATILEIERVYLPSDLSIARLHREFLHPEYIKLEEENSKLILAHEPCSPKVKETFGHICRRI